MERKTMSQVPVSSINGRSDRLSANERGGKARGQNGHRT